MQSVSDHALPPNLASLADEYSERIGVRDRFVWKWYHLLCPAFRIPVVDCEYEQDVRDLKTCLTFYVTALDDLVDQLDDRTTFEEVAKLPFEAQTPDPTVDGVDEEYLSFMETVWRRVERRVTTAPRAGEFLDMFQFDLRQMLNAIRHTDLVNSHPETINLSEYTHYAPHNMAMLAYAEIDLMHSSSFDRQELGALRALVTEIQYLARIGNWVTTWERELLEEDFSSGVIAAAVDEGIVSPTELRSLDDVHERVRARITREGVANDLLERWDDEYERIRAEYELDTVDVDQLLDGIETVLEFQRQGEGYK